MRLGLPARNDQAPKSLPLWACFAIPAALVTVLASSIYASLRELEERAPFQEVPARVVKLDCNNHGNYSVSFVVEDRTILRDSVTSYVRRNCQSLSVGQSVSVWYSSAEPTYVAFVAPAIASRSLQNELGSLFFAAYPLFVIFLLVVRRSQV
jgi:hypothetical protein